MFKKILDIILTLCLIVTLIACGVFFTTGPIILGLIFSFWWLLLYLAFIPAFILVIIIMKGDKL